MIDESIAAVIPVRRNSSRVEQKVMLPFGDDLTLLNWKLKQLEQVLPKDRIYVSTDCPILKEIATEAGVQIHHRDPRLCLPRDQGEPPVEPEQDGPEPVLFPDVV